MRVENLVLLVEDDAPLKRSLEKFLSQAGYAFDSCSTAREALVLAEKLKHDVVILEYHLPDADGSSLLQKLTLLAPEAVAIVLSEYDFQAIANELDRVKIQFYLKKPFDLVELEAALSSASTTTRKAIPSKDLQPNPNIESVPASSFMQGTLRDGN